VQKAEPTLIEVHQLFEEWRRNKKPRERIPAALWEAAVSLSRYLSADRISKLLNLNHSDVRDHIRAQKEEEEQGSTPEFIELDMGRASIAGECSIEMEKPDGAKMKISFKGEYPDIVGLSKAFWGKA
jgi:hypothetical protein